MARGERTEAVGHRVYERGAHGELAPGLAALCTYTRGDKATLFWQQRERLYKDKPVCDAGWDTLRVARSLSARSHTRFRESTPS